MLSDVGGVQGPQPIQPDPRIPSVKPKPVEKPVRADAAEISDEARLLEKLSKVPETRLEKIEALKQQIEAGTYETTERLEGAVERMLDELLGR